MEPPSSPVRRAGWGDYWRLNRLTWSGLAIVFRKSRPLKVASWFLGLTLATLALSGLLLGPGGLSYTMAMASGIALGALVVLGTIALVGDVLRLAAPNRWVAMSTDGSAALDVVFNTRRRLLRVTNHTRLGGSSASAAALRQDVPRWIRELAEQGWRLDLRAQNRRVAQIYAGQFEGLLIPGKADWLGRIRMEISQGDQG